MTYKFDKQIVVDPWCIEIDSQAQYGCFENTISGTGGGLWFDKGVLYGYDGVFALPPKVTQAIKELGFIIEDEEDFVE